MRERPGLVSRFIQPILINWLSEIAPQERIDRVAACKEQHDDMNDSNRSKATRRIGLFGGSFDPPHLGHLALVQAGLDIMGLDEVWVIPAMPVHRVLSGYADGVMRLDWMERAFQHQSRVRVLDWEVQQEQATAMVDTLRQFKTRYPDTVPWLMLGSDAWDGLTSWHQYPAHQELCNIAVFARQGYSARHAQQPFEGWTSTTLQHWKSCMTAGHCCEIAVTLPDISATMIRKHAALGLSFADLVPKVLQSDIEKQYILKSVQNRGTEHDNSRKK